MTIPHHLLIPGSQPVQDNYIISFLMPWGGRKVIGEKGNSTFHCALDLQLSVPHVLVFASSSDTSLYFVCALDGHLMYVK